MRPSFFVVAVLCFVRAAGADEPDVLQTTPLAVAFGSASVMWGMRLSPDGSKISGLQMHPEGVTFSRLVDLKTGTARMLVAGKRDEFDVSWCQWKNDERLLCGMRASYYSSTWTTITRLAAVDAATGESKMLLQGRYDVPTQFQDQIVDWLPDDPESVLVQVPNEQGNGGYGVSRLNVYSGAVGREDRARSTAYQWISDGQGSTRLYRTIDDDRERWFARAVPDADWSLLRESRLADLDDAFVPIGFGAQRNELLYFDREGDRRALHGLDLEHDLEKRVIYSHPALDVDGVMRLGKYDRLVAASYIDDRARLYFFDPRVEQVYKAVERTFPGKGVYVIDEDWNARYYLIFVSSAEDPGTYYRFDTEGRELMKIAAAYPGLAGRELAPMTAITYPAADGTAIPAYLTRPAGASGKVPAIVLPHGGPSSRDYWSYNFLVQYLVASGYAVLQSNYRGSDGYGAAWLGAGGFQGWRVAVGDIADGTKYLVDSGIADPDRICVVGWSYGGYAALLSAIEHPDLYRCVVSIAGVTDPLKLKQSTRQFVGGAAARAFIGDGDDVLVEGSPLKRAAELEQPVLLFHAERDVNVPFAQSEVLAKALARADKDVSLIEYRFAEHDISPERYRVDMLARLADFLSEHTGR